MPVPIMRRGCIKVVDKKRNELPANGAAEAGLIAGDGNLTLCLDKQMSFHSGLKQRKQVSNSARTAIPKLKCAQLITD